jgi:TIR domain/Novel STAND NTPase 1
MPRVFLSYRHVEPDQSIAKYIYRYLTDLDHEVFFDSENLSVGTFWHKEIRSKIERAEWFIPLISLAYLNSPYILEHELSVAAQRLKAEQIEGILQVNLAFDGTPPDAVKEVVTQIQFLKWKSPDDTPELARDLAEKLPSPRLLVKGMRSFGVTDGPQFEQLGRADQISQFITLLNQQTNRLTLLHGVSGSGKTSFIKAGVLPKIRNEGAIVYELERDTPGELDVLNSEKASIIILDQFEQSLIRLSADDRRFADFRSKVETLLQKRLNRKLVFCIRDEYRTSFDTMLPRISSQCTLFPLLPLEVGTAANVLQLLLENVRVTYDAKFLPTLCGDLAEGVPRTVLPALLQLITQHFRNHKLRLDGSSWDRLMQQGNSLFEQHITEALLRQLPRSVSKLDACRSLEGLTSLLYLKCLYICGPFG